MPTIARAARTTAAVLLAATAAWPALAAEPAPEATGQGLVEIITGGPDEASIDLVQEIGKITDDGATRRLVPVIGRGAAQNLVDLKELRGTDLAIVPLDTVIGKAGTGRAGNGPAGASSPTYVARLYNETLNVLASNNIHDIDELKGKKISIARDAAVTGPAVLRIIGIDAVASFDDPAAGLEKVSTGKVAAFLFLDPGPLAMTGQWQWLGWMHFLAIPFTPALAETYVPAAITSEEFPYEVPPDQPVDTVAVGTVMLAAGLKPDTPRYRSLANFVASFFAQFPRIQDEDRRWRDVNIAAKVPGLRRFAPAEAWLAQNLVAGPAGPAVSDNEMAAIFSQFLDSRAKVLGGTPMSAAQKSAMFRQFEEWSVANRHP